MRWIRVEVVIGDSPMIGALADALGVSVAEAVGLHALVWAKLPEHAPDGALGPVADTTLERWATWRGKRGAFAKTYRTACCDEAGYARDWERVNGAAMRESAATTQRVRDLRARRKGTLDATPAATPPVTPTALRSVRRTSDVAHASDGDGDGTVRTANSGTAVPNTDLSKGEPNLQKRVENSVDMLGSAETSPVVTRFMARFYCNNTAQRRADVARQMTGALIHTGVQFKSDMVKAVDLAHLEDCCLEVMEEPPRDANAAWVFVLGRLQDTYLSTLSARAKSAAARETRVPAGMTGTAPIGATPLRAAIAGVLDGLDVAGSHDINEADDEES